MRVGFMSLHQAGLISIKACSAGACWRAGLGLLQHQADLCRSNLAEQMTDTTLLLSTDVPATPFGQQNLSISARQGIAEAIHLLTHASTAQEAYLGSAFNMAKLRSSAGSCMAVHMCCVNLPTSASVTRSTILSVLFVA